MPSSTDQVPLVTTGWLVVPLYYLSLFLPLIPLKFDSCSFLFIQTSDTRLESVVFTLIDGGLALSVGAVCWAINSCLESWHSGAVTKALETARSRRTGDK